MFQSPSFSRKSVCIALLVLLVATIIAYWPSLSVPFYLDDRDSIVTNTVIQAPTLEPLLASDLSKRFVGYLTVWANYHINELDPFGYHVVNIVIHLFNALLVYWLANILLNYFVKPEQLHENTLKRHRFWAFAIAAVWALHPLNSQPVIYVIQRLASIVAIFSIFTVILYIKLRQADTLNKAVTFGALLLVCAVAGFHAKQNYVGIFVFIYVWELYTCHRNLRRQWLVLSAFSIVLVLLIAPFIGEFWQALDKFTRDANADSRSEYFYTQMLVLWDYWLRFFYPFSPQLEIQVELKRTFEPVVALALTGHILLMISAYRFRVKVPLVFIGVALFYTSHLVESFIIPIKDLAFEHRTYISNIGSVIALIGLIKYWYEHSNSTIKNQTMKSAFVLLLLSFAVTDFLRAVQWQDPLEFYASEVVKAPEHARANASYGKELAQLGRFEEAERYLKKSYELNLAHNRLTTSGLTTYMTVLYQQKKYQQATRIATIGLKHVNNPLERSMLLSNLAVGYIYMGYCDFAVGLLTTALNLNPNNNEAKSNLAYCHNLR